MRTLARPWKKTGILIAGIILSLSVVNISAAQKKLTASTLLTIVDVTKIEYNSADLTQKVWVENNEPGYQYKIWPDVNAKLNSSGNPAPVGYQCYLDDVTIASDRISWNTTPYYTPYDRVSSAHTINSMLTTVYSEDEGKTWILATWDFLLLSTHSKGLEHGPDSNWQGTIVNTLQDNGKAAEDNGHYRTNLFFQRYGASWVDKQINKDVSELN